ncbi:hypothetical protein [Dysgonomonas massiliensis]|uniref:hypothetical protein n=1 Tax=Dysgonomonas massiliensis TaxID=2040292 RepID=UPI0011AEE0D8|nr:hypothetical protein [Dysgonomonas massiliensis]
MKQILYISIYLNFFLLGSICLQAENNTSTIIPDQSSILSAIVNDSLKGYDIEIRDLTTCIAKDKTRDDISGIITIDETLNKANIRAYFDTNLDIIDYCNDSFLDNYPSNTIIIEKLTLSVGNDLNGIQITHFIPQRIFSIRKDQYCFFVFEMYNFSYTTVGGGYTYIIIQVGENSSIDDYKIYEYSEEPIMIDLLLDECLRE